MNKLIITADDYGMCPQVNEAIEKCVASKAVQSTNVMVNMSCCNEAAELKKKFPYLSVGLHYNFTVGSPISATDKVSSLVDKDGVFLSYNDIRNACKNKTYDFNQVKTEIKAQYERFVEISGEPDYWNTHQNVHVYPDIYNVFRDASLSLNIRRMRSHQRIYVPSSTGKSDKSLKWTLTDPIKRRMLNLWQKKSYELGVQSPNGVLVIMLEKDKLNPEYVFGNIQWKKNTAAELVIHPSISAEGEFFGKITQARVDEFNLFSDNNIVSLAESFGVEISNFIF